MKTDNGASWGNIHGEIKWHNLISFGGNLSYYDFIGIEGKKDFRGESVSTFTAVLHKEGDLYVAECPEVGTASHEKSIEEAIQNLQEATEVYLEGFHL